MHSRAYDRSKSYQWNYDHPPSVQEPPAADRRWAGSWKYCGLPARSPLGIAAGPLLNGRWCLYYAALGFDILTYKTVRSGFRACYDPPNLQPVQCTTIDHATGEVAAAADGAESWAVSFGMPSQRPEIWRADVAWTRRRLPRDKLLAVSVVGTDRPGWTLEQLAADYARCAAWAVESGADAIEANLSCPNVSSCDGQLYQHPRQARRVAQHIRAAIGAVPLVLKIGHVTDARQAQELVAEVAPLANALAMTNSIAAAVRGGDGELLFGGQRRGICGKATLAASLAQVGLFAEAIRRQHADLQLIGVGGVSSARDVKAYLDAGSHAVHLATAAMLDPLAARRIGRQWDDEQLQA